MVSSIRASWMWVSRTDTENANPIFLREHVSILCHTDHIISRMRSTWRPGEVSLFPQNAYYAHITLAQLRLKKKKKQMKSFDRQVAIIDHCSLIGSDRIAIAVASRQCDRGIRTSPLRSSPTLGSQTHNRPGLDSNIVIGLLDAHVNLEPPDTA